MSELEEQFGEDVGLARVIYGLLSEQPRALNGLRVWVRGEEGYGNVSVRRIDQVVARMEKLKYIAGGQGISGRAYGKTVDCEPFPTE